MGNSKTKKNLPKNVAANTTKYSPRKGMVAQPTAVREQDDHAFSIDHGTDLDDAPDTSPLVSGGAPNGQPDTAAARVEAFGDPNAFTLPAYARDQFEVKTSAAGKPYVAARPAYVKHVAEFLAPSVFTQASATVPVEHQERMNDLVRDFLTGLPDSLQVDGAYKAVAMGTESLVYAARQIESLPESIANARKYSRDPSQQEALLDRAINQATDAASLINAVSTVYNANLTGEGARKLSISWPRAAKASLDSAAYRLSKSMVGSSATSDQVRVDTAKLFASRMGAMKPKQEAAA